MPKQKPFPDVMSCQYKMYRHLKILEAQLNVCFRHRFLPGIIVALCITIIIPGFHVISHPLGENSNAVGKLFLSGIMLESYLVLIVLGTLSGKINKNSGCVL